MNITDNFNLSIILPFYKKLNEFKIVLPKNSGYFERNGIEVIIVMDEPNEQKELIEFIKQYPFINWKVLVNEKEHPWRNPAKVINVGIKNSSKDYVMVMSPESEIINDAISILRKAIEYYPDHYAIGRVMFADLNDEIAEKEDNYFSFNYGSIMVQKTTLMDINGYSENYTEWGGEDTNIRSRLELNGVRKYFCEDAVLVHREDFNKASKRTTFDKSEHKARPYGLVGYFDESKDYLKHMYCPQEAKSNDENWGTDFNNVIYDWENNLYAEELCRKYLNGFIEYEITNNNVFVNKYKLIALVQAYNESKGIKDFIDHLENYCDGIILLDDGSDDATYDIAKSNKLLLKVKKKRETFNDLENRNILLNIASFFKSKWFYFIDVDERFDKRFGDIYSISENDNSDTVLFNLIHLWNDENYFRADYPYSIKGVQGKYRMFKNIGRMQINAEKKLHFQPVPYLNKLLNSNLLLKHYGLLNHEDRLNKYNFYKTTDLKNDQQSYDHLIQNNVVLENINNLKMANNY